MDLTAFAAEVGSSGAVVAVGGRTQWHLGGEPAEAREVTAPGGIVEYEPAEMVVRVGAGTAVTQLDEALAAAGQMVVLDPRDPDRATVGGVLAAGESGFRRLRYGPIRDVLLEARYVSAEGEVIRAGAPVVKNVTGFDLCRLLVGSLGTIGILGEVVLRCLPRPRESRWFAADVAPQQARRRLFRPSSILWNGSRTWVLLEGDAADVKAERAALDDRFEEVSGPPGVGGYRRSVPTRELPALTGQFVAEVGIGTVHVEEPAPAGPVDQRVEDLHHRIKEAFDPEGRLNPGRRPW